MAESGGFPGAENSGSLAGGKFVPDKYAPSKRKKKPPRKRKGKKGGKK